MYKSSETEIVLPMERSHSWSSAPASKAGEGQTSESSNLSLSASFFLYPSCGLLLHFLSQCCQMREEHVNCQLTVGIALDALPNVK